MNVRPPSGSPPPGRVRLDGRTVDLGPVAARICERYRDEFPDERERYGEAGLEWCRHDNAWLLSWAVDDVLLDATDLDRQVAWLARVLDARGFPLERLVRNLEIAAAVAEDAFGTSGPAVATRLAGAGAALGNNLRRGEAPA